MSQRIRLCKRISVVQRISGVFLLLLFVRIFCLRVHFLRVFVVLNIINCIVIAISVCILYRIRIFDQILLGRCFSTKDKSVSSEYTSVTRKMVSFKKKLKRKHHFWTIFFHFPSTYFIYSLCICLFNSVASVAWHTHTHWKRGKIVICFYLPYFRFTIVLNVRLSLWFFCFIRILLLQSNGFARWPGKYI